VRSQVNKSLFFYAGLFAGALSWISGCSEGPELGDVHGIVTYNKQPVHGAVIEFRPVGEGKQSVGYSNEQGEYELQYTLQRGGALIGRHKVSVRVHPPVGAKAPPVPAKFGRNSEVEFDVQPGSNQFDIELGTT
jgi:hypothetical protein